MKYLQDVHDFHAKFNIPQPKFPSFPAEDITSFRLGFIREEVAEIEDGVLNNDLAEVLDGLVDLVYVALGMALMYGFDFDKAWDRVQAANMSKIAGLPTDRHNMLDVTKPDGWIAPDLEDLCNLDYERKTP